MILADEGLNGNIVRELRKKNFDVDWILELHPGMTDQEIIVLAKKNRKILITEDKDFGEWVFAHKIESLTIIFLRYEKKDFQQVMRFLKTLVQELVQAKRKGSNQFITINKNKVRRREI